MRADPQLDMNGVLPPVSRVNVLGVGIHAITLTDAVKRIREWIRGGSREYVSVCAVHTVMECRNDAALRRIVNSAGLAAPDGMPLVWLGALSSPDPVSRVYGPSLMLALCEVSRHDGTRHYFYGGEPGVARRLADRLCERFPGLTVAGTCSPPYRPLTPEEDAGMVDRINAARPHIVWVGLGTPKQDLWMASHRSMIEAPVLIGVGAAFDFHSGRLRQAPPWIQNVGLEWLFRLLQEPRRLWFRYLVYNPLFVAQITAQLLGLRRFPLD